MAVAAGIFAFVYAYQEAIVSQDEQLRQMAVLINRQYVSAPLADGLTTEQEPNSEFKVAVQEIKRATSHERIFAGELAGPPTDLPEGLQTVSAQGESWRVFVKTSARARVSPSASKLTCETTLRGTTRCAR